LHLAGACRPACEAAIEAKRKWLRGEITDKQLAAAWDADAAWATAGAAAGAAAWAGAAAGGSQNQILESLLFDAILSQ
jgi:hypothetical protein